MPTPPRRGRATRPAGRERTPLTRERIVDAAMAIVDSGGLDAVSMRTVALSLGTGPASLYAHVSGKDELLALMIERLAEGLELPEPDPEHWQEQVKALVRAVHYELLAHRDLARAGLADVPLGEAALRFSDRLVALLELGGLPRRVIAYAVDLLPLYAVATAYRQSRVATEDGARYQEEVAAYLAALPADRFPHLVALAPAHGEGEGFEFGLDVLVAGLAAYGRRASTA
jgi:TetR/AcrR family tetracycline transcriptional repressor